ncbi:MAG TPA: hypothetical protein VGQ39_19760 [Pyrinomonadaceae bacterium]|jgi:hypothetical protein|nr:hypothetical protein [Pyrinomonadaceae bacterium]
MELTEANFSENLNTKFSVSVADEQLEIELVEVKGYRSEHHEQQGMERFSIYFQGTPEFILPQGLYSMGHARMGSFEIFLVPIKSQETGIQYEAVFNYFREQEQ